MKEKTVEKSTRRVIIMSDSDSSTEADPQAVELANAQAAQIAVTQQLVAQLGNQLDANGRLLIRHVPLTLQEQELLTDTIPLLAPDNLHGVIQIIRDAAKLTGEEDEIDLEIDQLDTQTQRKLLRYVTKVRMSNILNFLLLSSSSLSSVIYICDLLVPVFGSCVSQFVLISCPVHQATKRQKGKGDQEDEITHR